MVQTNLILASDVVAAQESATGAWVGQLRRSLPNRSCAKRFEASTKFSGEELGLFPGRNVPALVELVVIDKFGIRALCPTLRGLIELIRKDAHGCRDGYAFDTEKRNLVLETFPIEALRKQTCSSTR